MVGDRTVYTLAEAAALMRVPYAVVRDAVYAGRWPHVKISARRRVMTGADIDASLELMRHVPTVEEKMDARATKARIKRLLAA